MFFVIVDNKVIAAAITMSWKTPITKKKKCNLKTTTHKIQFQKSQFLNHVFGL